MKRLILAAAATLAFAGPLAATAAQADPPARHDNRGADNDRNDQRSDRRDSNRAERWDASRHNGYSYNGRWHYGAPPSAYVGRPGLQFGYHAWRRGDRLPSEFRNRYRQVDYRQAHLRAPPRGYHYVRDDRGDTLLVAVATGVILSVILSQ
jgi:Ni/Co efflux regulator RcnB